MENQLFELVMLQHNAPSKGEILANADHLATELYEGRLDKYQISKMLVYASAIVEQFDAYKKLLASAAPAAVEQLADGANKVEMYGATLTIKTQSPAYDFSESERWTELDNEVQRIDAELKAAKKRRAAQEGVLKAEPDAEKYIMYHNEPTVAVTLNK